MTKLLRKLAEGTKWWADDQRRWIGQRLGGGQKRRWGLAPGGRCTSGQPDGVKAITRGWKVAKELTSTRPWRGLSISGGAVWRAPRPR